MPAHLHRRVDWKARRQKGKLPDEGNHVLYYTHYVAWLNRIAAPVMKSYSLCFYAYAFRVQRRAYATSGKLPLLSKVPKLLRFVKIVAITSSIIRIMPKLKVAFWVGIHCRLQANRIIHHGTTVFVTSDSGVDSTIDHDEGAFSHNGPT